MEWTRLQNLIKTEIMGLDVGSSAVKAVRLNKNESGYSVVAAGITEVVVSEDDSNHLNTVNAIRECCGFAGGKTKLAVCGLSGPEVAVRDFEFPSLSAAEIDGAVLFEASQVCPFSAAESVVDYHLISNEDEKTSGILVAAMNTLIADKVNLTKEAALKCVLMDVEGLALLNCYSNLSGDSDKSTIAILNVGGSRTTLAIMGDNKKPFVRDMSFAGNDIIKHIAVEKSMSTKDVRSILSDESSTTQTELSESLGKACKQLIVDISNTLRYYATQAQSTRVEKINVCGGFALTNGFIELLNNSFGIETVLWNPLEEISGDAEPQFRDICSRKGPALAVAAGLAMRTV